MIAISALGRALERRDGRDVLSGEPQPWNAVAPLSWIFEHAAAPPPRPPARHEAAAHDAARDAGVAGGELPNRFAPPAEVRP